MAWETDGVRFSFIWPLGEGNIDLDAGTRERNRNACVLRIEGAHHSIILPGDIGADEERSLVRRGLERTDVVLAAHHGSRYSSAQEFIDATRAQHAIAQAARWNPLWTSCAGSGKALASRRNYLLEYWLRWRRDCFVQRGKAVGRIGKGTTAQGLERSLKGKMLETIVWRAQPVCSLSTRQPFFTVWPATQP